MKNSDEHSAKSVTYGKKVVRKKSGQREKQTVQQTPVEHTHTHTYKRMLNNTCTLTYKGSIQYTHTYNKGLQTDAEINTHTYKQKPSKHTQTDA
jgi:hypothetical protein